MDRMEASQARLHFLQSALAFAQAAPKSTIVCGLLSDGFVSGTDGTRKPAASSGRNAR
jgi:hypothetical protein